MTLFSWRALVLPHLLKTSFCSAVVDNLTLLAYFFWDDDRIETEFPALQCAILCAYYNCGKLPTVLVVNRLTQTIRSFARAYEIELQVEPSLSGGLHAMSKDCIGRLYNRFKTDYVLIVQNDGMPVRPGIEAFVGKYDFVGAPWPGHCTYTDWFPYPKFGVGNGGFCVRSRKICLQAAKAYERFWRYLPYSWFVCDDVFYCKTMPFLSSYWRREFRFPTVPEAIKFSVEAIPPGIPIETPPLGFHSHGFDEYVKRFGAPMKEFLDDENSTNQSFDI